MSTPAAIVRSFYDAIDRGDVAAVVSLLDAEIEWTEAERFPYYSGTWRGPQAVIDNLLVPLSKDWDGFSAKVNELIAEGDRVVALGSYSGKFKKSGRSFSAPFAHIWSVRGDKLARFNMHTDTAKVLEAIGG
jgi:uncharacterized protein